MNTEFRSSSWKAEEDKGIITGYAVVFESRAVLYKDPSTGNEYGEIIDRHALDNADLSDVILRYDHEGHVLARTRNKTLKLNIDDHGLKIEADMTQSEEARHFYEEIKNGLVDKMSFAFVVDPDGDSWDKNTRTRRIRSINKLFDVAIVSIPAYEQTEVDARKALIPYAEEENNAREIADLCIRAEGTCKLFDVEPEPFVMTGEETEEEIIKGRIQNNSYRLAFCEDVNEARILYNEVLKAEDELKAFREKRRKARESAATLGTVIESFPSENGSIKKNTRGVNMSDKTTFYNECVEKRAAAGAAGMTAVIPDIITDSYVIEKAPGAFLDLAQVTHLAHAGTINIPVAALQTVASHTENTAIPDNGYVPGVLTISHGEYVYKTAYSDLGFVESAEQFQEIIENVCMESALKKMDDLCLGAVAGFTFVDGTNAVEVANGSAPTYAEFMELAGYLGNDFVDKAKWFMAPSTYFNWLLGLKDSANRPILDASKKVEDQAFAGFGIALDAQIPDSVIYFGDASRIHMNFGRPIEINAWDDLEYNQRKVSVRCVVGAAAESGCMVKMYEAAAGN